MNLFHFNNFIQELPHLLMKKYSCDFIRNKTGLIHFNEVLNKKDFPDLRFQIGQQSSVFIPCNGVFSSNENLSRFSGPKSDSIHPVG